ncbi:iron-containing alcohol dehydrogenase [Halosquirtibacter xylanolyticus]|uniref:iron-containing alcohol dehydrogenase n=1 Tax=Halosquirtibacter xylanolyticus TaxID=3374599 RepID=UPI003749D24B|nr:iron-containing alcohol dehydrogenase [Prolixibacteraceae bacterium]
MKNFSFHNSVNIVFGKGQISKLNSLIDKKSKVMMLYGGGSIKKNGVYDQVMTALKDHQVIEFSGIEPNPVYETLMKAVEIIRQEKVDFLLAVGGGSVLDGTKFISSAVNFKGYTWDIMSKNAPLTEPTLPIGTVLTLPATGSEMNANFVVTNKDTQEKLGMNKPEVLPQFSILDPEAIYSLPERQISNGIVDSFIHTTEQYLTYPDHGYLQDRQAEGILKTLVEIGPKYLNDKTNYDLASNFMWCATNALNGLIGVGVPQDWVTHMIGHELTAFYGVDHGQSLAVVLPGVLEVKRAEKAAKLVQYAERVWGIQEEDENKKIDLAIQKTIDFFESLGVKTRLSDYGINSDKFNDIKSRFERRGMTAIGERGTFTPDDVVKVLELRQ